MNRNLRVVVFSVFFVLMLYVGKSTVEATVEVTRNVYSNNGSMKFEFKGLFLDTSHEYEFGLAKTSASQPEKWFLITEYTAEKATVDVVTTTKELRDVFNEGDTGYVTIKDKTASTTVLEPYSVD